MTTASRRPSDRTVERASRWWDRAAAVLIGLGVAVRLVPFLDQRPLWIDEALLALNVASRGFVDLLRPLEHHQIAPIPFLWASRAAIGLAGVNEYALRLVPLLAGLGLPLVLWRLARRVLGRPEGLFVATLAGISPALVYYSNEFKQYGVDALVAAVLVAETARFLRAETAARSWVRLAMVGVAALLCSQPAVFALAGTAAALVVRGEIRARPVRLTSLLSLWGGVFGVLYLTSYAPAAAATTLQTFWESTFLKPGAADFVERLDYAGRQLLVFPLFPPPSPVPLAVVTVGFLAGFLGLITRRDWSLVVLVGVPFAAVGLASMAGLYPMGGRLLLFLAPLTFVVLSGTVSLVRRWIPPARQAVVQLGLCLAPLALNAWALAVFLFAPGPRWNTRSIIASLPPDPTVYVAASSLAQWLFYTTDWQHPDRPRLARLTAFMEEYAPEKVASRGMVRCEGDHMVLHDRGRLEIVGLSTGVQFLEPAGLTRGVPVPGWAENEARRIRAAGDSVVWVFFVHHDPLWAAMLRSRLVRAGGHVVEERVQDRWHRANRVGSGDRDMGAAYRVVFRGPPATDSCPAARLDGNPRTPPSRRDTT